MLNKPNLFIIGTHKAGTTALMSILYQHPEIYFPSKKMEMHHFESDIHKQILIGKKYLTDHFIKKNNFLLKDYLKYYDIDQEYKVVGDKTPSYIISRTAASEICNFNKDAKIIVIFRDPVDYMYSLHSQNLYNDYESTESFEEALNKEEDRKKGINMNNRELRMRHLLLYRERANYKEQFKIYLNTFPIDNIKCIIFEDFKNSNANIVNEIECFLDVERYEQYQYDRVNTNKKRKHYWLKRALLILAETGIPQKIIPTYIYEKQKIIFNRITTNKVKRIPMEESLYRQLKIEFLPGVNEFETYLKEKGLLDPNYNLKERWGYNNI